MGLYHNVFFVYNAAEKGFTQHGGCISVAMLMFSVVSYPNMHVTRSIRHQPVICLCLFSQ